jgi:hypothetical protein
MGIVKGILFGGLAFVILGFTPVNEFIGNLTCNASSWGIGAEIDCWFNVSIIGTLIFALIGLFMED